MTSKWGRPARKMWHLVMAHTTANSSSLIIAYWLSGSDRKRDPAWIKDQLSPVFCCRTKPSPCQLASVHKRVSLLWSKYDNTGADVNDFFTFMKAASNSLFQMYSFFVRRSGCDGTTRAAMLWLVYWLTAG